MKNINKLSIFIALAIFTLGCQKNEFDVRKQCKQEASQINESKLLLEYFEKNGDPVNCKNKCTLNAKQVYDNLNKNIYVIDLRSQDAFNSGHIEGSVRLAMNRLFYHFNEKLKPFSYNKIVLVCYSGQSASFATCLLRLQGFYNVYALRWGMASWNDKLAGKWKSKTDYKSKLALTTNKYSLTKKHDLPEINTGKVWRSDIMKERTRKLLSAGFKKSSIKIDDVNESDTNQIILAYCSEETYNQGHPKGAIFFPIKKSLKRALLLQNLPTDKELVVYSENGFESSYAAAYLRILGYNAKSLLYGTNMFQIKSNKQFSLREINNYPLVKTNPESQLAPSKEEEGGC